MTAHAETGLARIPIDKIFCEEGYQPRIKGLEEKHVRLLLTSDPGTWPPLVVTPEEDGYAIIDGAHRYEAARRLGLKDLPCQVKPSAGYPEAFEANIRHGLPLSLEDRKAYARWIYEHEKPNSEKLSYREIGRRCGLSHHTVKAAISGASPSGQYAQSYREEKDPMEKLVSLLYKAYRDGTGTSLIGSLFSKKTPQQQRVEYVRRVLSSYEPEDRSGIARALSELGSACLEASKPYLSR
jgi:ParB-like chromosome segregation protein Spo0J